MMTITTKHPRRRETSILDGTHHYQILIRHLPFRLGFLVGLRDGEWYCGFLPLALFGRRFGWWWRPTFYGAIAKGEREARRRQRTSGPTT